MASTQEIGGKKKSKTLILIWSLPISSSKTYPFVADMVMSYLYMYLFISNMDTSISFLLTFFYMATTLYPYMVEPITDIQ